MRVPRTSIKSRIVRSSVTSLVNSCLFSFRALLRATMTSSEVPRMARVFTMQDVRMARTEGIRMMHTGDISRLTDTVDTLDWTISIGHDDI